MNDSHKNVQHIAMDECIIETVRREMSSQPSSSGPTSCAHFYFRQHKWLNSVQESETYTKINCS